MAGELLLDTGALVSLLDRSQRHHGAFVSFFGEWNRPVVSTEAVLTEATRLLGGLPGGRQACMDFFLSGGSLLVPATTASLRRSRDLVTVLPRGFREQRTRHDRRQTKCHSAQVDPRSVRVVTRDDEKGVGREAHPL